MSSISSSQSEEDRLRDMTNRALDVDPYNLTRYTTIQESQEQPSMQWSDTQYLQPQTQWTSTETQQPIEYQQIRSVTQLQPATTTATVSVQQQVATTCEQTCEETSITQFKLTNRIINAVEEPLTVTNATQSISICNDSGIHVNKEDESGWNGQTRLLDYPINCDEVPTVIHKQLGGSRSVVNYTQNVTIKYLKPPRPAPHGDIIVQEECDIRQPLAPPIIIRQTPMEPITPAALVFREAPPQAPLPKPQVNIRIPGRLMPPPARRVIIEKLPQLPAKPQGIIIERWLPYEQQTRNIRFIRAEKCCNWASEKNMIIYWDQPQARVTQQITNLGTVRTDPTEYVNSYGRNLLSITQINQVIKEHNINLPLSPEQQAQQLPKLAGDLAALSLIDLDRYGLGEYKYLQPSRPVVPEPPCEPQQHVVQTRTVYTTGSSGSGAVVTNTETVCHEVFSEAQVDMLGKIAQQEGVRLIELINLRLGKKSKRERIQVFMQDICINGSVDFEQFKRMVVHWFIEKRSK